MREIPAGRGAAVALQAGQAVRLVNTFGSQVVDTWALACADPSEYLSVEHTRRLLGRLFPRSGDTFFSNRRNPLLLLERDSSGCRHDMLLACCDPWLYRHYGAAAGHRNCEENFREALAAVPLRTPVPARAPNPVNFWMNVPVSENERLTLEPPCSRPGDELVLRARVDVLVVFSACPMDITPVNGSDLTPRAVHYEIIDRGTTGGYASPDGAGRI